MAVKKIQRGILLAAGNNHYKAQLTGAKPPNLRWTPYIPNTWEDQRYRRASQSLGAGVGSGEKGLLRRGERWKQLLVFDCTALPIETRLALPDISLEFRISR